MRFRVELSDTVVSEERGRLADLTSVEDIGRCYAGSLRLFDGRDEPVLALDDAPVFGFALEWLFGLHELLGGGREYSFNDFYGEYAVSMNRAGEEVMVREEHSGKEFRAPLDELKDSSRSLLGALRDVAERVCEGPVTSDPLRRALGLLESWVGPEG